jgi:dihydroorotate dehydrogenase (NAD+) catalytic subunit
MTPGTLVDLSVDLGSLRLANPVMPASGCFGPQLGQLIDLNRLGALVTKTIFLDSRSGNPAHRLAETEAGMLNSVGNPSPGAAAFLDNVLPRYTAWAPPVIVSVGGLAVSEYGELAARLRDIPGIAALEVNVSCPNLEAGGLEIGANPKLVETVVRSVVNQSRVPVIAKLTPNITSIADIAIASEAGGATAVTAINTPVGLTVDPETRRPTLGNVVGGLSGPAIKPIALRMVWEIHRAVSLPVIGVGGIATTLDALQFFIAGATAVQLGTVNFTRPTAMLAVIDGLAEWMDRHGVRQLGEIVGSLRLDQVTELAALT